MTTRTSTLRIPAELSLVLVTLVTALSFGRMFVDWTYLSRTLVALLASHSIAIACRYRKVPLIAAAAISAVVGAVLLTWLLYQGTTRFGLPTAETLRMLSADAREGVELFRDVRPPATPVAGFIAGTVLIFWIVAFLADWSAFRLSAPFEALLPTGALFVFSSLFAVEAGRFRAAALYVVAALLLLLLHRSAQQETTMAWTRGDAQRGARSLVRSGTALLAMALVAGVAVGPLLPGAGKAGVLNLKALGGQRGTRITVSPLVDIRSRLVQQSDRIVFTVKSPSRAYWRLTSLDSFDGTIWKSSQRFSKVSGSLPSQNQTKAGQNTVEQVFTIDNLAQIWLPAAFEASAISATGTPVRWEASTSTLIVDEPTSDGLTYKVNSKMPRFSASELNAATGEAPEKIGKQFLALPAGLSPRIAVEAQRVTGNATNDYQQALALQQYFRDNFAYSLQVRGGHNNTRMDDFLFRTKAGYCEQFAGTFAAMARTIGLPARVSVGFTTGEAGTDGTFTVRGRNAHAWPEVYINGYGWVLFEPTPGRGAPAADYTGVPEAQDDPVPAGQDAPADSTSTTVDPNASSDGDPNIVPPDEFGAGGSADGGVDALPLEAPKRPVLGPAGIGLFIVLGLAVLYTAVVLGGRRVRRARRVKLARTPGALVAARWQDAVEDLGVLGLQNEPSETPSEFALRAERRAKLDGAGLGELAELTTAARYSTGALDEQGVQRAANTATAVMERVRSQTSTGQRLNYELSPKQRFSRWRRARRQQ